VVEVAEVAEKDKKQKQTRTPVRWPLALNRSAALS
jgi:hypothetical protein